MFPTFPCSVRSISASSPVLLMNLSLPGCPAHSSPQRTIHSLNPSSHPRPPRLCKLMNCGWTISLTGESHPRRMSPISTFATPIPRVGITTNLNLPLLTTIKSTPSCLPPCSVYFCTDHGAENLSLKSRSDTCQVSRWMLRDTLVSVWRKGSEGDVKTTIEAIMVKQINLN